MRGQIGTGSILLIQTVFVQQYAVGLLTAPCCPMNANISQKQNDWKRVGASLIYSICITTTYKTKKWNLILTILYWWRISFQGEIWICSTKDVANFYRGGKHPESRLKSPKNIFCQNSEIGISQKAPYDDIDSSSNLTVAVVYNKIFF